VGGGIVGCAAAAHRAETLRVVVLEREPQPGYHATGRSAAVFSQVYGSSTIRALTRASRDFLIAPPADFAPSDLVVPRGCLYIARDEQVEAMYAFLESGDIADHMRFVEPSDALDMMPCLRAGYVAEALYEPGASDVDVHSVQQGYVRRLRGRGSALVTDAGVLAIEPGLNGWEIETAKGSFAATVLVNAAGAWVDEVARLARVAPLGIRPLRRTACTVDLPAQFPSATWPLTIDIGGEFYFKPDAGRLLLSPADETPSPPCDALPDDEDVALAVDRVERATSLSITHVRHKWAGLRSFFADRNPAIGFDARVPGFFWIAGLGGYGIQTAPAVCRLAAALLQRRPMPADISDQGLRLSDLAPTRLFDPAGCATSPLPSREPTT